MAITKYATIPTREQWRKGRDNAGGKSGLSSKVNLGKLLDYYQDNKRVKSKRAEALDKLEVGMRAYVAEPKVREIKDLLATARSLQDCISKENLAMKMDKDLGLAVANEALSGLKRLDEVESLLKGKKIVEAAKAYGKFYDGIGRGMGKILPSGEVRDYWQKIYETTPDREKVGQAAEDKNLVSCAILIVQVIKEYRVAINEVLRMSEEKGLALKL